MSSCASECCGGGGKGLKSPTALGELLHKANGEDVSALAEEISRGLTTNSDAPIPEEQKLLVSEC